MSVWKEIRCDAPTPAEDCLSHTNLGPKGFEDVRTLKAQARKQGWVIAGDDATCPKCWEQFA